MKKSFIASFIALTAFVLAGTYGAAAQLPSDSPTARKRAKDLYTQYGDGDSSTVGAEGAKVAVLLKRGNRPVRIASVNETFYSGDRIKFVFDVNFEGWAAILNTGPTGRRTLLFPYWENGRLADHTVSPNAALQLPRGGAWIRFDARTGDEQVTVVFAKNRIAELGRYEQRFTDGRLVSDAEADDLLAEFNRKTLGAQRVKDIFTETEDDGTYYIAPNGIGRAPVVFTFTLRHR